jgi:methionine salvage enolase-phosphatase E1
LREIEISKAVYQIKNSPGRDLYESLVDSLNEWVNEDVKNTDKLIKNIKIYFKLKE